MQTVYNDAIHYAQAHSAPWVVIPIRNAVENETRNPNRASNAQCEMYWNTYDTSGNPSSARRRSSCIWPSCELG